MNSGAIETPLPVHAPSDERPLHVLLTDPHLGGGGQVRYIANLARELTARGHRITIGCREDSVLVESAQQAGCVALDAFPFRGGLRPRAWSGDLFELRRYIRRENPDIVHVNLSQDHWSCGVGNRLMGFPACLVRTRHNTYPVRDSWTNRILNRRWTDYQISVCDSVRRTLSKQPTFDADRICTIHNGVDAEAFAPDAMARARIREEFGYAPEDVIVGIAARLVPAKGHEFLFRAVRDIAAEFPQLRVLVLGEGELRETLERLKQELGLDEVIRFAGFRDDMAACVQAFDIGVQPSIDCDTSSFSLKEQMAAEKAVVASDHGGLTEIVTHGIEGFVAPQGSVEPLAGALAKLISNPMQRRKMGEDGRKRVLQDFTVQVFADRTVAAYRKALEFHRTRHRNA